MADGGSKMAAYVFAGIAAILVIILIAFAWQGNKIPIMKSLIERQWDEQQQAIEDKHKVEIDILNNQIAISESKLTALSKNYSSLVGKIREKSKQKADIRPPKDEQEIKDRLNKLGYKAEVRQ